MDNQSIQDISLIQDKIFNCETIINNLKNAIKVATKKVYSKKSFILNIITSEEKSQLFQDLDFLVDELAEDEYKIHLELLQDFSMVKENIFFKITALNNEEIVGGIYIDVLNSVLDNYESVIYSMVHPSKDVGAFNVVNTGLLFYEQQLLLPPLVSAVIKILEQDKLSGKHIVIVNKSSRFGKSLGITLLQKGANVSILDNHMSDFKKICKNATIVVSAIDEPLSLNSTMLKKEVMVIDIGDPFCHAANLIYSGAESVIKQYIRPDDIYELKLLFILYNFLRVVFFNNKALFDE